MGDRANIKVCGAGDVYLYTHWAGTELPETLKQALMRDKSRWDDSPYLARIIFCEMVRADKDGTTGYGISGECGDGADRVLTVDADTQVVTWSDGKTMSFQEYIDSDEEIDW